jgi:hypothetical protein
VQRQFVASVYLLYCEMTIFILPAKLARRSVQTLE